MIDEIRRRAHEARRAGIKPEHVVIAIHTAWEQSVRTPPSVTSPDARLTRLIEHALNAYFDSAGDL